MKNPIDADLKAYPEAAGKGFEKASGSDSDTGYAAASELRDKAPNLCGGYYIDIGKEESVSNISLSISMYANLVVLIGSSVLGRGDDQQGSTLMNRFLYSITRMESVPAAIILINSGVFLVSEGSPVLEHLQLLEKRGVEIVSSSSCLEYYNLQDKMKAGYMANMYDITEKLFAAARLISI